MIMGKEGIRCAIVLLVVLALLGSAQALPDLVVTSVTPNCGELFGNESNVIEAQITNIGNMTADASNASFVLSGGYTEKVIVPILDAGNSTIISIVDPTIRTADVAVNINVTADCDGDVSESNETNNTLDIDKTVVNNGYKGKRYTGGEDITTWEFHDQAPVNLIYSTGDSTYQGGYSTPWTTYTANWTAEDLPIPDGATIKTAVLYAYYTFDRTPAGNVTDYFTLSLNGHVVPIAQHYTDRKGYGSYDYPYGMIRYSVKDFFNGSGNNEVLLENTESTSPHHVSLSGMMLTVVYEHADEPMRTIWINEGFDILSARDSYCVTSEEATAYVPFTGGAIETDSAEKATLVTVMQDAFDGDDKNRLYFNGREWQGIWDTTAKQGTTSIAINETDVLTYLDATGNEARLQSHIPDGETMGDGLGAANTFLMVEYEQPDLIVTSITPNCGYLFANESNEISATVKNNGSADAGAFTVCFVIAGFSTTASVSGLGAGNDTEVSITDFTNRTAGTVVNITVTADCDGATVESNEANNVTVQAETVVNNGYKGKRYTGGEDITTWEFHDQAPVNLIYSTGDSMYQGGYSTPWTTYTANWSASNLPIPSGATIKTAVLYAYYTFDRTPAGNVTDYFTMSFNGHVVSIAQHYTDRKGYGSYDYPYGMIRYSVKDYFNGSGNNEVLLENTEPTSPHHVSLSGMMLTVVYEHADEPMRTIWINEGFDILSARDSYCVTSEEATAYVPFTGGSIETDSAEKATLVTVMQDAFDGDDKSRLYFNGGEWPGIWDTTAKQGDTSIAINETDVLAYLGATGNEARLQSHIPDGETMGDGLGAANVILTVELETTPPVISNVQATLITTSSAKITWMTDELSNSTVEYGTTTAYGYTESDGTMVTNHSISLTGLSAGTTYHYRVKSTDAAGNPKGSCDYTFTTSSVSRGGGRTSRDTDGDGYSDIEEILAGTDPNNADDYPYKSAVTPVSTSAITPTPKPTPTPVSTPVATPAASSASAAPTPTPEEPGFEAICAIAYLVAIAYAVLRKKS